MNIKEAKEQIKNAMTAYFTKDEFGYCRIPVEKQRPVFLIGPPGIGKTAIMEQVASELGVGLVSYSMTHHTRQSALGLPFIVHKEYDGREYEVSEYTMSEIIGSVYDLMRDTGLKEGILFLDEINCVSETLAPCMLQFLQYKVFGQHRVPDGWIVVTAGNPPEYNKSVRDFDIVTWDRLKRIDVEPDYDVWKEYAYKTGVHASVMTYLAARKKDFYRVESTVDGKSFVTARGWDDLSEMIHLYEANGLTVDGKLIGQYLQNKKIARDFAIYYDLYNKYRSDYQIETILQGNASETILFRAENARFDERLSLLGILLDAVTAKLRAVIEKEEVLSLLQPELKEIHGQMAESRSSAAEEIANHTASLEEKLEKGRRASSLSQTDRTKLMRTAAFLEACRVKLLEDGGDDESAWELMRSSYEDEIGKLRGQAENGKKELGNVFDFCEKAFGEGQEILLLVTELTANYYSARFIGHYGCDKYFEHNKELQFYERQQDIIARMDQLETEVLQ